MDFYDRLVGKEGGSANNGVGQSSDTNSSFKDNNKTVNKNHKSRHQFIDNNYERIPGPGAGV